MHNAGIQINARSVRTKPMLGIGGLVNGGKVRVNVVVRSQILTKKSNKNQNKQDSQAYHGRALTQETSANKAEVANTLNLSGTKRISLELKLGVCHLSVICGKRSSGIFHFFSNFFFIVSHCCLLSSS